MPTPPLFGLVLAGGASTRMGQDKAALAYHGRPQLQWAYDLLTEFCAATFVSVRPDQRSEPTRAALPQIIDRQPGIGPIAGITAALAEHPKAAWLVVACDLPFITPSTLRHLIEHRDQQKLATAYRSSRDSLPEPLCAVWEPAAREPLLGFIDSGKQCPRKFLLNADVKLLALPEGSALVNVNTEADLIAARAALKQGQKLEARNPSENAPAVEPSSSSVSQASNALRLRVQYFAVFREQAGCSEEALDTQAQTPAELYGELQNRHPFKLAREQLKVAINSDFSDWNTVLQDGDTVVFIPPVAGG